VIIQNSWTTLLYDAIEVDAVEVDTVEVSS